MFGRIANLFKGFISLFVSGVERRNPEALLELEQENLRKQIGNDPKTMWSNAIDWTVTDPGLIVASAEFLMEAGEPASAVEVLKGNLRKGLAIDDWAHDALALGC